MSLEFENLGLQPRLVQAINQLGYEQPTPIQQSAIPVLLEGHDVIGQAQTGTGKTAAFVLPMLQQIEANVGFIQALVLAPTRELAIQVAEAAGGMASQSQARILAVYGGQSYQIQTRQLRRGVDVVVGTPGRLLDLINQKELDISQVRYLVLDEADEMLEMGFIEDVETILKLISAQHQTALFSATLPEAVRNLAERYLTNPQKISINPKRLTVEGIEQRFCVVREDNKLAALTRLLEAEDVKSALIFARTKARAQELSDELNRRGITAEALHGDLNQSRREAVLQHFRQRTVSLLVATDVAARGLDIDDISHVFNYDVPQDTEDYVHRIGRTGRAGRKGVAISFFTSRERRKQGQIEAYTRQKINEISIPSREEILKRRDERFIQRLTEQLGRGSISHERSLISQLENTSFDIFEIAAAAIRLARANEANSPVEEIMDPVKEHKRHKKFGEKFAESEPASTRHGKKGPRKDNFETSDKNDSQPRRSRRQQGTEPGMVRLLLNLGGVHGVRPGDIVGAIASEVGIPGRAIGEIDIRKDFSFVDVAEKHVNQVLKGSTGRYFLRGKPVMLKLANN
ncbi:MAG: DEAD/DEAH box helicase [Anaerolineae bacterium]|nr:DEAD/DEAH box helicase [Anaerolineae bacterium]